MGGDKARAGKVAVITSSGRVSPPHDPVAGLQRPGARYFKPTPTT